MDAVVDPERVLCPHCVAYLAGGPGALPADDAPDPVEPHAEDLLEEPDRSWHAEALLGAEID